MSRTHEERAARRRLAAGMVAAGKAVSDVARELDVTEDIIRAGCHEQGVPLPPTPRPRSDNREMMILASLFDAGLSMASIAAAHGITKSRVQQVWAKAVAAGIPGLPERRRGRN